jgi:hypothetical protein
MRLLTRLYSVHLNPREARPYESPVFVPEGFNFYAFFFHIFWALYHRIWLPAFIIFGLLVCVQLASTFADLSRTSTFILDLGIRLMIGMAANDLRRDTLEKRGWVISDVVIADSLLDAERRYYDRHLGHIAASLRPVPAGTVTA